MWEVIGIDIRIWIFLWILIGLPIVFKLKQFVLKVEKGDIKHIKYYLIITFGLIILFALDLSGIGKKILQLAFKVPEFVYRIIQAILLAISALISALIAGLGLVLSLWIVIIALPALILSILIKYKKEFIEMIIGTAAVGWLSSNQTAIWIFITFTGIFIRFIEQNIPDGWRIFYVIDHTISQYALFWASPVLGFIVLVILHELNKLIRKILRNVNANKPQ